MRLLLPLDPAITTVKTSIRPGNSHEWEAMVVLRPHRRYEIKISCRAHIRGTPRMSEEIHVQPGTTYYTWTLDGARRRAQRMVEQLNDRDGLEVPIARIVEVRPNR